ncbi:MAG: FAD-binding oxidoreductase [Gemmataceae bacterium]|nr:FAD-binding oxidoreductase [Gemmataceae bacterium]
MRLLIIGGGLFGSLAAVHARSHGIETLVFDPGLDGAASPAAAGIFSPNWISAKMRAHFDLALPMLERHFGIAQIDLAHDDGRCEKFSFVSPLQILDPAPLRKTVTAVGDGWLEADGERYAGWIYVAAGVWCSQFASDLQITSKAGAAYVFAGERPARIRQIAYGRQVIAFVRDAGTTHFTDGTAEADYSDMHNEATLERARQLGLTETPITRIWGRRPYTPGGPVFKQLGAKTWLATGGRKLGTILGASFARRLVEEEFTRTR